MAIHAKGIENEINAEPESIEIERIDQQSIAKADIEMTFDERLQLASAVTGFSSIWDIIKGGKPIAIECKAAFIIPVELVDKSSGDVQERDRSVFVDSDGKSYATTSDAVANTLRMIFAICGEPGQWERPINMRFETANSKNGQQFVNLKF